MSRPGGKSSPRVAELGQNQRKALELRIAGKTFDQISAEMGEPRSTVRGWVAAALAKADHAMAEKAQDYRELEADRLDAILRSIWPAATLQGDDQLANIDRVLKIMERRAKLLGLDAPVKNELTGKDGGPLEVAEAGERIMGRLASLATGGGTPIVSGGSDS